MHTHNHAFLSFRWPVRTISFNHTGEYIASASEDLFIDIVCGFLLKYFIFIYNFLDLFDNSLSSPTLQSHVQTGRPVHQIPCRAAMNSVEWNPKHNLLAYAGDDKNKYQADEGQSTVLCLFLFLNPENWLV